MKKQVLLLGLITLTFVGSVSANVREKLLMDANWKFAYGHPSNADKDFGFGTGYFSYFAKAGYADGAAAANFDDRAWRIVNVPHDYAVEQGFDANGSHSHGYKAIGRNFPDVSVGWYRKTFTVPNEDLGRRISITFDGVHRDSKVFINGHYLGNEASGYNSFTYDITQYLNYGSKNVLAVRTDVTDEEGWYYEGAGIYRHVWMTKTSPLHVANNGTFVYTEMEGGTASVIVETEVQNENFTSVNFTLIQYLVDQNGTVVAKSNPIEKTLGALAELSTKQTLKIENPKLWSIENPYLYKVQTILMLEGDTADLYETKTGIRTLRFDPDHGLFLNGEHVKLKGTNNHQDHAGVGTAIPDELQRYRIMQLKKMGSNAMRSSHNPATPAFLDACDELGMLVIDENRLMGTAPFVKDQLERLIKRDRNHPSVIVWSMGNEEWGIEGNIVGERIIAEMQAFANQLDPTRPKNAASSGGWGWGVSRHIEMMGFNYLNHGSTDDYHAKFPDKPSMGTEEGSTNTTRGIYFDDEEKHYLAAYDRPTPNGYFFSIEHCWKHYATRDYLAGMFIWTGFDYRGEPTPFGWPSIHSYFGMYDDCGFPKDDVWYLKAWWGNEPVLHLLPHWNLAGHEGDTIQVVAYSNCDEVELYVNGKRKGKKQMEVNGHVEWMVPYQAGELKAIGYKNGKIQLTEIVQTTGEPVALKIAPHKTHLKADGEDLLIFSVSTVDKKGRHVPTANNLVAFELDGPAKIIGVGNGDPTCLEPDKYIDQVSAIKIENMKARVVENGEGRPEVGVGFDDSGWSSARKMSSEIQEAKAIVYRGTIDFPDSIENARVNLFYNCIGNLQTVYINGEAISGELNKDEKERYTFQLDASKLKSGKNVLAIVATPYKVKNSWDSPNTNPGLVQVIIPAKNYQRSLFSGYAQVIVQTTKEAGEIKLRAISEGIRDEIFTIQTEEVLLRPSVE
ncbi:MAG: beta-galactosidase GalA [Prolixibacteraceae bacterium]